MDNEGRGADHSTSRWDPVEQHPQTQRAPWHWWLTVIPSRPKVEVRDVHRCFVPHARIHEVATRLGASVPVDDYHATRAHIG